MDVMLIELACFIIITSVIHITCDVQPQHENKDVSSIETRLYRKLTHGYNSISRPVTHAADRVQLTFGISLNQILDLDGKHQILSSYVWIYERWRDTNLIWRPEDYGGLDTLMFPASSIWLPDVYIFNRAGSSLDGFVNVSGSNVMVSSDGYVTWSVPLHIKSACPVDATYFPYDKQSCDVHFGSWIYDISQIDIFLAEPSPDISNYVVNNEFDLQHAKLKRSIVNDSCCPGEGKHPMIHLSLLLKRKTNYYDYIVIAPTINLCILTLATFLLPCECGWKIAIGLTVFLTLYVLQLLIAENVPDTNSTPLISVFLLLVMSLNCISLITATIIMNIKRRSLGDPPPPVPKLLLYICEKYLSKLVCTSLSEWKRIAATPKYTEERVQIFPPAEDSFDVDDDAEASYVDHEQYIQLQDLSSNASMDLTDKQFPESSDVYKNTFGRTGTAESSFSYASTNDTYSNDNSYSDCLLKAKKHAHVKRHENGNYLFDTDVNNTCGVSPGSEECTESTHLKPRSFFRNRPSYRRAIMSGHTVALRRSNKFNSSKRPSRNSVMSKISRKYQWYFVADVIDTTAFVVYLIVMLVGIFTVLVVTPLYA